MDWIQIGNLEDIPRQGSRVVNTSTGEIALFRSVDDQVFALNNRCPHKGGPLSQGIVHGKRVREIKRRQAGDRRRHDPGDERARGAELAHHESRR